MHLTFTVPGKPVGKGRPKFSTAGGFARAYTPEKTASYENLIKICFMQKFPGFTPLETPLHLNVRAFFVKAKSNKMKLPMVKPDADNIIKAVGDALNNIAFKDDKQIISVVANKLWGDIERLEITINED